ncbi:serine--pyruvate aminotransferase [Candidatus Epulonipiscium fishelsonii]|uniref:Serine--pyruvate aminotransferase n=1 Tax=Candidatus Epulonipiscium fishelsonii TaxID=77094 RepID=A0ACC8X9M7_9FIRM|nr:serine--pyruvate aminotransferase [Epulopiscium sp. SCG-B05WGA-EpuloA1]ONI38781.1 serine--pyruvate aminotransferase [Epulopiscium sp. SCG-B11WGA-EpuloA1]
MFWRISKKFQFAADKIIPDSFVFCIVLTLVVFVASFILTDATSIELATGWYDGLWSQNSFAFQMSLMVVVCGAAAKSPAIERLLKRIAKLPRSREIAMIVLLIFGIVTSIINWAFSLIVTAIFAKEIAKNIKNLHFPLVIAASYSTMLLGQLWCPNSSVYALLATENHFMVDTLGIMTQDMTTYTPINTIMFFILAIATIVVGVLTTPPENEVVAYMQTTTDAEGEVVPKQINTWADRMNNSSICILIIAIIGLIFIVNEFIAKGFIGALSLNFIIFVFIVLNLFLYRKPVDFVEAIGNSMKPATQIMLQFPFYGGIMGLMASSGLASIVATWIIGISTAYTLPLVSYLAASVVNLFVPSQGGQWIIQGPILIEAAKALDAHIPTIINAFSFGDQATNLLQPLYLIPALSVVNMKLKDVWGFCAFIWIIWTILTCIGFTVLPAIL